MLIELPGSTYDAFKAAGLIAENVRPGYAFEVNLRAMSEKDREKAKKLLADHKNQDDVRSIRRHISAWEKGRADPRNARIATFKAFAEAMADYLVDGSIRGWVFETTPYTSAWTPRVVYYYPPEQDDPASIYVGFERVRRGQTEYKGFSFGSEDTKGASVVDILEQNGFQKETQELLDMYDESMEALQTYLPMYGKQFQLKVDIGWQAKRNRFNYAAAYEEEDDEQQINLADNFQGRLVHDETDGLKLNTTTAGSGRGSRGRYGRSESRRNIFAEALKAARGQKIEATSDEDEDLEEGFTGKVGAKEAFTVRPNNLVIRFFHLGVHVNFDAHVDMVKPYAYDQSIKEKLILPERTMRLLETLTAELNLVQEDIVKGKSGGNMVLLGGPPGTGKTLTMEVLAEAKQVPLFLVHSGLLGTTPDSVEKKLRNVYARAAAWGDVVVGIDEADVFVRERGDDVVQNAIVAVFLRTLEYQNGTIFMTTNRIDDIDDAIKSRASAIIKYTNPSDELKVKIWKTLSAQFLPNLDPEVIEQLVPSIQDDLSGRDIKGILRLADRYQRVGHELDLDTMKDVAGFRGLQVV